jgi:taurine dioxygenase
MASIDVRPLEADLSFGARITGVDREAIADEEIRQQIRDVFEDRGVVVFEDVEQTGKFQAMLSKVIGPLKDHPVKTVARVDNDDEDMLGVISISTRPDSGIVEVGGRQVVTWQPWHFDHAYNDELNRAGLLRSETIAPNDGLTGFADGIQIYRDFDPALRAELEDKICIYTLDLRHSQQRYGLPKDFKVIRPNYPNDEPNGMATVFPRSLHPAIWTRDDGQKVYHMHAYGARAFVGMENEEGEALAQAAIDEMERVAKPYYHMWKPTDMVLWDNWRVLHKACGCDPKHQRVMHRTTIKGDYGLGAFETPPTHEIASAVRM